MVDEHEDRHGGLDNRIAIVGMAAHLPGSATLEQYWLNLRDGLECIRHYSESELLANGEDRARMLNPNYVPAAAPLDGFADFDAGFFGLSPKEAAVMDPQHRQFLEVAWEALETAGHPPEAFKGPIGVYAGCGMGSYFYFNVCSNADLVDDVGMFLLRHTGNDKDFLATRVSHVFDLKGPSISIQTACSTSLVAIHYACQSLLAGETDLALAGGSTIELPQGRGYIFQDGEILSPDGHCHAFDHRAEGTVFGSGAGVVVLRRLEDALADGDHIFAVICGTAVNNDGAAKAGYLAPSVDGQSAAISEALDMAGTPAHTIGYVECHGTGTRLGDPIEVAALTQAFRQSTEKTGFCGIGSVKTNIGHLDTAAGVASTIKVALALKNRKIPPSLGFERPNPAIDFETSPFYVNTGLADWVATSGPRRAGVNSLGVGGTNAHAILEEAPEPDAHEPSAWPAQILTLSARSEAALNEASGNLAAHLRSNPDQPLEDVAFTLKEGRRAFEKRRVLVAEDHAEAADRLEKGGQGRVFTHTDLGPNTDVVFMFPGGGAQYVGMARNLYETEPVFQDVMDRGLDILDGKIDYDIRALWLAEGDAAAEAEERLKTPSIQLPLIMITEYALAQLWMSWGVTPAAMIGHSLGENTAACLAGVLSFEDCIGLVHLRGALFDRVPPGGMLSIPMSEESLRAEIGDDLDIACINAPDLSVVSGSDEKLAELADQLAAREIEAKRVPINIAAHSRMLDPILPEFEAYLRSITLNPPQIPIISNRTGQPLRAEEATDPSYWVQHLRNTVHFSDGIATLAGKRDRVYLEVGPGRALSSLAKASGKVEAQAVLSSLRHADEDIADDLFFLETIGRLWACGIQVDWDQIWGDAKRRRVPLPTYPFQRKRYFIEPADGVRQGLEPPLIRSEEIAEWGFAPAWLPRSAPCPVDVAHDLAEAERHVWLVFCDTVGLGAGCAARLRDAGHTVIEVRAGDRFLQTGDMSYTLAPERGREGYDLLLASLVQRGITPDRIAHFWLTTREEEFRPGSSFFHRNIEQGFYSLMFLAQAISEEDLPSPIQITIATSDTVQVRNEALLYPEKATVAGPARVIPRELPGVTCRTIDVSLPPAKRSWRRGGGDAELLDGLVSSILEEMLAEHGNSDAALRGGRRYELGIRTVPLEPAETWAETAPEGAVWFITGGFGGIGLSVGEKLARETSARLVLVSRSPLPDRSEWDHHLRERPVHDLTARRIEAVRRLEAAGAEVMVATADVCNVSQMRAAIAAATERFGPIHGVIHAAGTVDDAPLLTKDVSSVENVFSAKIHGTQVLDSLFPDGSIKQMVLFSSTSTITAPAGQIDYVAANEYLNAYAKARTGDTTRVVAINWGIWKDVGMAAEAMAARHGDVPRLAPRPVDLPLLDETTFDEAGNRVFTASYTPSDRWILDEHRTIDGTALLPGTGYIELIAEALHGNGETGPFEINDLYFFSPLQVDDGTMREVRVSLIRRDEGYRVEISSDVTIDGRKGYHVNAQAILALGHVPPPAQIELEAISGRMGPAERAVGNETLSSRQEANLAFGPRWRVIRSMAYGQGEGLAELSLPQEFARDLGAGIILHPALLDLATGWAMDLVEGYDSSHLWVPVSYGSIRVYRPLPAELRSWVRIATDRSTGGFASFDVTLMDTDGQIVMKIRDFSIHRVENVTSLRSNATDQRNVVFPEQGEVNQRELSPAEVRLAHNLTQGITPEEGAEAFRRALAQSRAQIVVTSLDLHALKLQAEAQTQAGRSTGESFERPDIESDYVAPRNDIERTLAGFWQDLLGLETVGVDDSFFDLGGHSLIAVRLFALIKKTYRTEFPISVLFETPTVASIAALIAERIGHDGSATDHDDAAAESKVRTATVQRRFTHLVPMHSGEGGHRTPFFLVAGMFGNVLNLRHLANLVGAERPFYGLQARGLYGDDKPHETLSEAAADYIVEMRQVQPRGPYFIGGFSGGGLTAYEIAHQLEAAGEEVGLLVMLDTPLPLRPKLSGLDKALIKIGHFREKGFGYAIEWAKARYAWEMRRFRPAETAAPDEALFHNQAIEAAFIGALPRYNLKRWDGKLVLFRPPLDRRWKVSGGRYVSTGKEYVFEDNEWGQWSENLTVIEVPGDHDSMVLEPNVRVLAAEMKRCIEEAEMRSARPNRDFRASW
ncbi:SDR family oxidoreductase [Erythrobacter sp. T5W1-R]|uniref:type I polyketide synthase n=1 Tax=Erythrobacter sp. T5W1-R TaxID=3101752 RepID=UPI002AFFAE70|nr:SDR family NAD(P)-dependent oxidoreductase [Erythrobacter sp. T5W1-R]MEA1620048.1 SDR family oxidoreductase [Erythrobacter sp. T5W1-R]